MYRILKCDKDTYITSKIIAGTRVYDANVGQAGTLDLYKLYDETFLSGTTDPVEISRALLHFDLSPLRSVTSSIDINDSSFRCFLKMSDIYGGQRVPTNYSLVLFPLSKSFDEGRGQDVIAYRDIDSTNWLTSSITNGQILTWVSGGADSSGSVGNSNIDFCVSASSTALGVSQSFAVGDEDLLMDITTLVSSTLAGTIPDCGFRLSFIDAQEDDVYTYFVKRFSSRHVRDPFKHPRVVVHYDDSIADYSKAAYWDNVTPVFLYNKVFGTYQNLTSGSSTVTGSNSLLLTLFHSASILVNTTSWSTTHSASITYSTSSTTYYSMSFNGSQYTDGSIIKTGIYNANTYLSSNNANFLTYWRSIGSPTEMDFLPVWTSNDRTVLFNSASYITYKKETATDKNVSERNFVVNITNLKHNYTRDEKARFRLFIQDYNTELSHNKIPIDLVSEIFANVHWRLLHAYTRDVLVPFDTTYNSTKLSSDGGGMYFDVYMNDLEVNQVYELEFVIIENNEQYLILNQGFRFKVIP